MKPNELKRLRFRRQYLLTPKKIECPFLHELIETGSGHHLYYHIDLIVTRIRNKDLELILLGDIFDYRDPKKNNEQILMDLSDYNFSSFLKKISEYSGRFVVLFIEKKKLRLTHDATAARKVYYCKQNDQFWYASQPYVLAKVLKLENTRDPSRLAFYNSPEFVLLNNSNVGYYTLYDEIFQVMPNHYFDEESEKSIRYWPNEKLQFKPVNEVADQCAKMIKGFVEAIANRYELMVPLTAGKDSRTLLAATREFTDKVYYYINKEERLKDTNADVAVPKKLLAKLNLDFHIISPNREIDKDFMKVYFDNHEQASRQYLPIIYNYFLNHQEKVNLPGNIASGGYEIFRYVKMEITPFALAHRLHLSKFQYAVDYIEKWLDECTEVCQKYNLSPLLLFYWEERLGNWGTQLQLEKDIAQEEINPFNSRELVKLYFSVKPKYIEFPLFILHRKIIKLLWPDVFKEPINPGPRTFIMKLLKRIGLLDLYFRINQKRSLKQDNPK